MDTRQQSYTRELGGWRSRIRDPTPGGLGCQQRAAILIEFERIRSFRVATYDGKFGVALYGHNVTDKYYWTNAPIICDTQVRFTGRPATYGVMFSYKD